MGTSLFFPSFTYLYQAELTQFSILLGYFGSHVDILELLHKPICMVCG